VLLKKADHWTLRVAILATAKPTVASGGIGSNPDITREHKPQPSHFK
jgi:hypothetical protein